MQDGRATGVVLRRRRGARGAGRRHGDPPEDHVPRAARPRRAARRLRRRHRALEDPQRHGEGQPRARPAARVHGRPRLRPRRARRHDRVWTTSTTWRGRSRSAVRGPPRLPFADICIPTVFDPTLAPEGKHVMSMFTQWVPHEWADEDAPRAGARGLRRPRDRPRGDGRARLHGLDPAPAGHRPVRDGARLRPHRRQHLPRRAVGRPAVPHAPGARLRRLPHADRRAVPGLERDPRRRRRDRHPGHHCVREIMADRAVRRRKR